MVNLRAFKKSKTDKAIYIAVFVLFIVYAVTLLYPIVWTLFNSLKLNVDYFSNRFNLPTKWMFRNYADVFSMIEINGVTMIAMLFNSVWFTAGGTVIAVFTSTMTAYVVSKYKFYGREFVYGLAIAIMLIPIVGALPAQYTLFHMLRIVNSPLILVIFTGGFGFNFLIMHGFFKNVAWSYAEAAYIDGAGDFKIFLKVMLPQARAPIFSLSIIASIGLWNDYMTPMLYLGAMPTLSTGLFVFYTKMTYRSNYPVYFTAVILSMIPVFLVFAVFQDKIMRNTVAGGLKG
ncbi:MAG: carbohydrate ABC transporter permease [Firmicutes bacterium]|nr:carbohydrate ABC transporter permease [Bacillota bacterium]